MQAQATAQTVKFAPASKQEVKALQAYIASNRAAINRAKGNINFRKAVREVRMFMRAYFDVNPAQLRVKVCPWTLTGSADKCRAIAEKYRVPYWEVISDANPGYPNPERL